MFDSISKIIQSNLPESNQGAVLHEPYFIGREWDYVKSCLDSGWVSSVGQYVNQFEKMISDFTGVNHAIVTVNGTAALHMCYLLSGVERNDEVLIPTLTFIATCSALHYCGAIPHFYDCEENHLGVDVEKLDRYLENITEIKNGICYNRHTKRIIRALCVMHTFGHPVDLDRVEMLAQKYHLALIEDAAEALGSFYKGKHVGNIGLVSALSFNGNKIVTTGGGGAILTNDEALAKKAKHLTTTAKIPHAYLFQHDQIGFNYRLPNINAALGCAQLEKINYFLQMKRKLAKNYESAFSSVFSKSSVRFLVEPHFAKSNYWLNAIIIDDPKKRNALLTELNQQKIGVRPVWELMHHLPMFLDAPKMDLSTAEKIASCLMNIPSSVVLGEYCAKNSTITA